MSTIEPDVSREVAAEFAKAGMIMLDGPLSGSPVTVKAGNASVMIGGDEAAFERAKPVLLAIGPKVTRIGGNGLACQMKIAVNLLLMVEVICFGEAVALAEKGGVSREAAVDAILKSVAASPVLGYRGPFILEGKMPAGAARRRDVAAEGYGPGAQSRPQARQPGAARRRRQRNDERLPRTRHRRQRFRGRAPGLPAAWRTRFWRTIMTSRGEKIGVALAKAVKAATGITSATLGAKMFRTNIKDVPKVEGLKRDDGWIDMQVQFLIDKKSAGADHVVGWTVLKPGASHECHRHRNCDEFFIVLKGQGHIITDKGLEPSGEGDVVYSPRGCWHGFNNTSSEDVVLVWGWMGAGSIDASGYESRRKAVTSERDAERSAHRRRHAPADRVAQAAARCRREADRLEGRARRAGRAGALQAHRPMVGFLLDRAELASRRRRSR